MTEDDLKAPLITQVSESPISLSDRQKGAARRLRLAPVLSVESGEALQQQLLHVVECLRRDVPFSVGGWNHEDALWDVRQISARLLVSGMIPRGLLERVPARSTWGRLVSRDTNCALIRIAGDLVGEGAISDKVLVRWARLNKVVRGRSRDHAADASVLDAFIHALEVDELSIAKALVCAYEARFGEGSHAHDLVTLTERDSNVTTTTLTLARYRMDETILPLLKRFGFKFTRLKSPGRPLLKRRAIRS